MRSRILTALLPLLAACDGGGGGTSAPRDAALAADRGAVPTDAAAAAPDAGPAADAARHLACACADAPEDCDACFRLISQCCDTEAHDETFGGRLTHIVATCRLDPNCASCCDECAARTCEQVIAAGDCPI